MLFVEQKRFPQNDVTFTSSLCCTAASVEPRSTPLRSCVRQMRPRGVVSVCKPVGPTSAHVVAQVKRALGNKIPVGHVRDVLMRSTVLSACLGLAMLPR